MDLPGKAAQTIAKHSMLQGGEAVLVAVSGGPDSVCLLRVLKELSPKLGLTLHAAYVEHGLRPAETPAEIEFLKTLCASLDVPLSICPVDTAALAHKQGTGVEEAARLLRYEALRQAALEARADKIAMGHNLNDQAETFFMRALRGSAMAGLASIPPVRDIIIRPLIDTPRSAIEAFLKQQDARFMLDSSNLRQEFLRNRIRLSLMPLLLEINPNLLETVSRTVEVLREEDRYLETAVNKALMRLITRKTDQSIELFLSPLENLDKVILRRALRRAVAEVRGLRGMGFVHIEDIIALIKEGRAGDSLHMPSGMRAIRKYSTLLLTCKAPPKLGTYTLHAPGQVALPEAGAVITASLTNGKNVQPADKTQALLDAQKTSMPLTIRAREKGDFFYPSGFGKRKKLQDFLVDEKVPRDERDCVPIVVDSEGNIVWVAGYRADERVRPDEGPDGGTQGVLVLEITYPHD